MNKQADLLYEYIDTKHQIKCTKCENNDSLENVDTDDAALYFARIGWTLTKYGNIKCPNCSKPPKTKSNGKKISTSHK